MKIFLAGGESRHSTMETWAENMKIFLVGPSLNGARGIYDEVVRKDAPYILESFFYANADTERLIPWYGDFMLDSGAFTFMQSSKSHCDWPEYIESYADFIRRNSIEKFLELDIDSVVGYEKVLEYRRSLEKLTGKQPIPVWHKSRGYADYLRTCDEYGYIAIGGIAIKDIKPEQYKAFPRMISDAHKRGCKVHGLGFTQLKLLPKIHFDSVDSSSWTTGNRFGYVYHFDGRTMQKVSAPPGKRLRDSQAVALENFTEWVKYQKYATKNFRSVRKPHEKNHILLTGMADSSFRHLLLN